MRWAGVTEEPISLGYRHLLRRLVRLLALALRTRTEYWILLWRSEMHRLIALFALSMAALIFAVAAVSFSMLGVVFALWETHRVLAFWIVAAVFALLGLLVAWLIRSNLLRVGRTNDGSAGSTHR
jgi:uncharacterized membrane protein YqjE